MWSQVLFFAILGAALLYLASKTKVPEYDPQSVLYVSYRFMRIMLIVGGIGGLLIALRLVL
jgi:hypothetical protein